LDFFYVKNWRVFGVIYRTFLFFYC